MHTDDKLFCELDIDIDNARVREFVEQLVNGVHPSLPESTTMALRRLLMTYQDVLSRCEVDLSLTDLTTSLIDTGDARPIRKQHDTKAIPKLFPGMLSQEVIEPACKALASNIVLVSKTTHTVVVLTIDIEQRHRWSHLVSPLLFVSHIIVDIVEAHSLRLSQTTV